MDDKTTQEKIDRRIKDLKDWLKETAPECTLKKSFRQRNTGAGILALWLFKCFGRY